MVKLLKSHPFLVFLSITISIVQGFEDACKGDQTRLYPVPSDCTKFIQCDGHGNPILMTCAQGLNFNVQGGHCDWPDSAQCRADPNDTTPTVWTTSTPSTITTMIPTSPPGKCPEVEQKVVCYFNNWAWYRPAEGKFLPEHIDMSLCTHILYAFAVMDESTWKMKEFDMWADVDNTFYKKTTEDMKERHPCSKTLIALGGWTDSASPKYSVMMNDPEKRKIFVQSTLEFCKKYKFDGLDLDIEYPGSPCGVKGNSEDKDGFTSLVKELSAGFKPQGLLLTAAVSANPKICEIGYDIPALAPHLDWFGVMTYDYNGHWSQKTGPSAPLYSTKEGELSCDVSIKYWLNEGCPPSKLLMGMPTYGQSYTLEDPSQCTLNGAEGWAGKAGSCTRQDGILAYYEILDIPLDTITTFVPATNETGPYFCFGDNQLVSYDDPVSFERKIEYTHRHRMGGFMVWDVTMDSFQSKYQQVNRHNELLSTIKKFSSQHNT